MERAVIRSILANEELNDDAKLEQIMNLNGAEITRDIRMEKEKTALYMITYKQSGNESVHKQEIAFRKNATAMRKQLESFCRANGLVYYPDRIKIMEGEDIYLRTKGKYDNIAKSARAGNFPLTRTVDDDIISKKAIVQIPQISSSTITKKIEAGEYGTKLSTNQYNKHKQGTPQYDSYLASRLKKGGNPQSILTITSEESQDIIIKKAGTGIVKVDKKGVPQPREKITCDKVIGKYYGGGKYHDTNKAMIHYSKKGAHIVPIKGDDYD